MNVAVYLSKYNRREAEIYINRGQQPIYVYDHDLTNSGLDPFHVRSSRIDMEDSEQIVLTEAELLKLVRK
jgi:hypothetical protein